MSGWISQEKSSLENKTKLVKLIIPKEKKTRKKNYTGSISLRFK